MNHKFKIGDRVIIRSLREVVGEDNEELYYRIIIGTTTHSAGPLYRVKSLKGQPCADRFEDELDILYQPFQIFMELIQK